MTIGRLLRLLLLEGLGSRRAIEKRSVEGIFVRRKFVFGKRIFFDWGTSSSAVGISSAGEAPRRLGNLLVGWGISSSAGIASSTRGIASSAGESLRRLGSPLRLGNRSLRLGKFPLRLGKSPQRGSGPTHGSSDENEGTSGSEHTEGTAPLVFFSQRQMSSSRLRNPAESLGRERTGGSSFASRTANGVFGFCRTKITSPSGSTL